MCVHCLSSAESLVLNGAGISAAVGEWRRRRRLGLTRSERRGRNWDETAAFLRSLGHEPEAVLGVRPGSTATEVRVHVGA